MKINPDKPQPKRGWSALQWVTESPSGVKGCWERMSFCTYQKGCRKGGVTEQKLSVPNLEILPAQHGKPAMTEAAELFLVGSGGHGPYVWGHRIVIQQWKSRIFSASRYFLLSWMWMESVPERTWLCSLENCLFSDCAFTCFLTADLLWFYHTHFLQRGSVILPSPCLHRGFRTCLLPLLSPHGRASHHSSQNWGLPDAGEHHIPVFPACTPGSAGLLEVTSTLQHCLLPLPEEVQSFITVSITCTFAKVMEKRPHEQEKLTASLLLG